MNDAITETIYFPYVPAMTNLFERWLSRKAEDGWKLEKISGKRFTFQKCTPYQTKYFSYTFFGTWNPFGMHFCISKDIYALKKSAFNRAYLDIYEMDLSKIDSKFQQYVLMRDRFYLKHYLSLLLLNMVYFIALMAMVETNEVFLYLSFLCGIGALYPLFSVIILIFEIRNHFRNKNSNSKS